MFSLRECTYLTDRQFSLENPIDSGVIVYNIGNSSKNIRWREDWEIEGFRDNR